MAISACSLTDLLSQANRGSERDIREPGSCAGSQAAGWWPVERELLVRVVEGMSRKKLQIKLQENAASNIQTHESKK